MCEVFKVENPQYNTMDNITKEYWDKWLIISERKNWPEIPGGKVLYYCRNRTDELERTLDFLDKEPVANGYPDLDFVGPSRGYIGGLYRG